MMTDFKSIFESRYTWLEGFMRNVRRYSSKPAMICPETETTWTYRALNESCNRLVNRLAADGFGKGDVLMVQLLNCPEFVFAYLAAHKAHGVCCPVSYRLSSPTILATRSPWC